MAKRRPNGGGTITKRADGRYQGAAYVTNASGQRVRKFVYGKTWDEAAEALGKLQEQERKGVPVPDRSWKLGMFLAHWLTEMVRPNVRQTTYAKYETMVRVHIAPHLGKKGLTKLTPKDVRAFLNGRLAAGTGRATVAECLKVLRNALNRAMVEELVGRNVAQLVDMPSVTKREVVPWSLDEATRFLKAARSHRLYAAFTLSLVLGLRRGEVLGLRWSDVDLGQGQFVPRKQVQRLNGNLALVDLKTRSSRAALPLPLLCVEALGERRRLQEFERQAAGSDWQDSGLVFTERGGGMIEPRGYARTFEAITTRVGLRPIRLHDARHTTGTLLAALKVHPRHAKEVLRHSQISVTLDIYTHVTSDEQRAAAAKLGAVLHKGINGG